MLGLKRLLKVFSLLCKVSELDTQKTQERSAIRDQSFWFCS